MKRIFCILLAALMLLPAFAEEDGLTALLDQRAQLQQQLQAIELQLEIAALNIQLAEMTGDADAYAAAQEDRARLEAQQADLAAQEQQLGQALLLLIEAEEAALSARQAELEAQLEEIHQARQELAVLRTTLSGAVLTGSAKGFQSDVTVTVTLDAAGRISSVEADTSGETRGFGTRVMEDAAFLEQFVGQTLPVDRNAVEAVSGATITSRSVVDAMNASTPAVVPADVVQTVTAQAEGFMDYVIVTVGLAADGTIATLEIDASNELKPNCDLVLADEFVNQFIGKKGPFEAGVNVDVATGATFSSKGAIAAINSLFPAEEKVVEVLTAQAMGFIDDVIVTVGLAADGTIATLDIDVSGEISPICDLVLEEDFINQFIGKKGPFETGMNVDVATGATFTSNAVIEALNSIFLK